jgi:rSAM/selenodomain-associated transferase 2
MPVSVVIPALNEEARIEAAIRSAQEAGAAEILVADGGSSDRTVELARNAGATLVECTAGRGAQSNAAAAEATGEILLFLHADTVLPPGACHAVEESIRRGSVFGGFRIRFAEPAARLRFVAFAINVRTSLTRSPWGDQAQFVRADLFHATGRFASAPLMEDYELALRMKRIGPTEILPLEVTTSGRRFLETGLVRTAVRNWMIVAAWWLGVPPERLARWYRRS